jgi:hypothetical protein
MESLEVLYHGTERLIESKGVADKVSIQLKGLEGENIKALQKEIKAVQDSISAIQDMIFGEENPNAQGITSRNSGDYANGAVFMAIRQITSRPDMPTSTEEKMVAQAKSKIKIGVDAINNFYENVWPNFQTKVEGTKISIFKEYEPLEFK